MLTTDSTVLNVDAYGDKSSVGEKVVCDTSQFDLIDVFLDTPSDSVVRQPTFLSGSHISIIIDGFSNFEKFLLSGVDGLADSQNR